MGGRGVKYGKQTRARSKQTPLNRLLSRLHGALSLDLRHADYPPRVEEFYWATLGHCYIAAEAVYHLWGKQAGYVPYVLKHDNGTHWWLVHEQTGEVVDPTKPQLDGELFRYEEGRKASFLTRKPSRRAQELIRRMKR